MLTKQSKTDKTPSSFLVRQGKKFSFLWVKKKKVAHEDVKAFQ